MRRPVPVMVTLALLLGGVGQIGQVQAIPITYTQQVTASGGLGGQSFTDALVTLTFSGDTSNVTGSGPFLNSVGTATVDVAGIGTATFTDSIRVFNNNQAGIAGISDVTLGGLDILDTVNSAFATYDLTTAIGPLSGSSLLNPSTMYATNFGNFFLLSSGDSTFTATTSVATPEPASLTLLAGLGLGGLLGYGWRRRKQATA